MRNQVAIGALMSAVSLFARPGAAAAQEPIRIQAGASFVTISLGVQASVNLPVRKLGSGSLTAIVGGGILKNDSPARKTLGGGLFWEKSLNDRTSVFIGFLAGVVLQAEDDGTTSKEFGASPAGGIVRKINDRFDFVVMAGLFLLDRGIQNRYGVQTFAGVRTAIGR